MMDSSGEEFAAEEHVSEVEKDPFEGKDDVVDADWLNQVVDVLLGHYLNNLSQELIIKDINITFLYKHTLILFY